MFCSLHTLFSLVNTRITTSHSCLDKTHCIYVFMNQNLLQRKIKFKLATNNYNCISFNFSKHRCWWTLCSLISMSFSFSPPIFTFSEISPWTGWGRDTPSSVDIITFLLSHPLLPIEHMYHCHAATIEHMHLVPHSELHQGTYQSLKKYWKEKANFTPDRFFALDHLQPLEAASYISKIL